MKKIILLFLTIFLISHCPVSAKKLQVFMSYSSFYSPSDGPYIETYLSIVGNSVVFVKNANGKYQGTIELTIIFSQDNTVKDFRKINLHSPEVEDTNMVNFNFIDQQRFVLPDGVYEADIQIRDINDDEIPFRTSETIEVSYPKNKIHVSGIQFIQSYSKAEEASVLTKSGYDLIPYIFSYYPETVSKLAFYAEVYNTENIFGQNEKYLLSTYIEVYETGQLHGDLIRVKKEVARPVNVLLGEFDISGLPTGNYNLGVEVRDKNNKLVAFNKMFFQRNQPEAIAEIADLTTLNVENTFAYRLNKTDTLADYLKSLYPISTDSERLYARNLLKRRDINVMQQYFYNFWVTRNNSNPEGAWLLYKHEVAKVNANYSTRIKRGYETDRGRVYLQYGPPNAIAESLHEPSAYPYEIWHYYTIGNQRNKRFVFCNSDFSTNDFVLIHSDAIGEIYDYRWKQKIYKRNTATNDPDSHGVTPHWGDRSDDFFRNPR